MEQKINKYIYPCRIGIWSCLIGTFLTLGYLITSLIFKPDIMNGVKGYIENYNGLELIPFIVLFLSAPLLFIHAVCITEIVSPERKIFGKIASGFILAYMIILLTNCFIQFFVVRLNILNNQTEGLNILLMVNLRSIFIALQSISFFLLGIGLIILSKIFEKTIFGKTLGGLYFVSGMLPVLSIIFPLFDLSFVVFILMGMWSGFFIFALLVVCLYYKIKQNFHS